MGMFDWINFKTDCPNCGKEVDQFQSKDGGCNLDNLEYWEVDNFYTSCRYCDTWIEYRRREQKPYAPIQHYDKETRETGCIESQFTRDKDGRIIAWSGRGSVNENTKV